MSGLTVQSISPQAGTFVPVDFRVHRSSMDTYRTPSTPVPLPTWDGPGIAPSLRGLGRLAMRPNFAASHLVPHGARRFSVSPRARYGTMGLAGCTSCQPRRSAVSGLARASLGFLGEVTEDADTEASSDTLPPINPAWRMLGGALSLTGAFSGAYHGYKRNGGSLGWAIGWWFLGGLFPVITIPVSLAQGFGKRSR